MRTLGHLAADNLLQRVNALARGVEREHKMHAKKNLLAIAHPIPFLPFRESASEWETHLTGVEEYG
jgi:hypothetical protein